MFSRYVHDTKPFISGIISECQYYRMLIETNQKLLDKSHILSFVDYIDSTIHTLAFYLDSYSVLELDLSDLDQSKEKHSVSDLISHQVILFDSQSKYCGVSFCKRTGPDDDTIYVSRHYSTAIMSFINYAFKSACLGSKIIFNVFPGCFEISYVGSPIPDKLIISLSNNDFNELPRRRTRFYMPETLMLFAAKRILDANGSYLSMRSEHMYDRNFYIESSVCEFLNSISERERNSFIHKDIDESQYKLAESIYERLLNHQGLPFDRKYLYTEMLFSEYLKNNPFRVSSLVAFEDIYMNQPIYKTTITVYYGKAKENIVS